MDGDFIAGAGGIDVCGHLIRKQVEASLGELHARQRKHPGELASHIHLLGIKFSSWKLVLTRENLGSRQPLLRKAALGDR